MIRLMLNVNLEQFVVSVPGEFLLSHGGSRQSSRLPQTGSDMTQHLNLKQT